MRSLIAALVGLSLVCLSVGSARGNPYIITDLGTLGGDNESGATGISNSGQVVGYSNFNNSTASTDAFLYSNGTMTNLGSGVANGVSPDGTYVVGQIGNGSNSGPAFLWSSGTTQNLAASVGSESCAYGVNNAGQVVGFYTGSSPNYNSYAFLYNNSDHSVSTLGIDPSVYPNSYAQGINASGEIAGQIGDNNGNSYAFSYQNGTLTILPSLGPYGGTYNDGAFAVNNAGQITGSSMAATDGTFHAFASDGTTTTDLGTINDNDTYGYAINSSGQVVGDTYTVEPNDPVGFLYSNGTISDLNSLAPTSGWTLQSASGVNDRGQIVGTGLNPAGQQHAFLMTPASPGDANLDGNVDINDLTIVLANYGKTGMTWTDGEFTGDGTVDINDLTIVLSNYGRSLGSSAAGMAAVPEPSAVLLAGAAAVGLLACAWRRRRAAAP